MMRNACLLMAGLVLACESTRLLDAGTEDSGRDGGPWQADAEVRDQGPADSGEMDAGFADPLTIKMGIEYIADARTYVHLRGTLTSTMPPLLIMATGPHQGGYPGFFGHFGGGIGHEYLPEHLEFLIEGRLMMYFDFLATGRSGFGAIGTSSVTIENHVDQIEAIVEWLGTEVGADTAQIDILGHGYGAGVGSLYAARHPSRVSRLVLVNPMAPEIVGYSDAIGELQARLTTADRQRLDTISREPECRGNLSMCTVEIWRIMAPRLACPANEDAIRSLLFAHGELRTFTFLRLDFQERQYDFRPQLRQIQAPTTVVSGPCDATMPDVALTYTSSIPQAAHEIIPNAGHWPMVEDRAAFQQIVRGALTYP